MKGPKETTVFVELEVRVPAERNRSSCWGDPQERPGMCTSLNPKQANRGRFFGRIEGVQVNVWEGLNQSVDVSCESGWTRLLPLSGNVESLKARVAQLGEPLRLLLVDGVKDGFRPVECCRWCEHGT